MSSSQSRTGTKKRGKASRESVMMAIHGQLARIVDALGYAVEHGMIPADSMEGELLIGLRPVLARFEERFKSTFSIPQAHGLVNAAIRTFCKDHEKPYKDRNANMHVASAYLMQAFVGTLKFPDTDPDDDSKKGAEFGTVFREAAEDPRPMCCRLTDEQREELLSHIVPSTGDEDLDEAEVEKTGVMAKVKRRTLE